MRRRRFLAGTGSAALAASIAGTGRVAHAAAPPGRYLTADELAILRDAASRLLPVAAIRDGRVDVAANVDGYLARFPGFEMGPIRKGLYYLNTTITYVLARMLRQATALDRTTVTKYLVTLGYYGEANGEADRPPRERRVWPALGYPGPLGPAFERPVPNAPATAPADLPDRMAGRDPLAFLAENRWL